MTNGCHRGLTQLSPIRQKSVNWLQPEFNSIVVHQANKTNDCHQNLTWFPCSRPKTQMTATRIYPTCISPGQKWQRTATRIWPNCRSSGQEITNGGHHHFIQLLFARPTITNGGHQSLIQLSFIMLKSDKRLPPEFSSFVFHQASNYKWLPPEFNSIVVHQAKNITNDCHRNLSHVSHTKQNNDKRGPQ